LKWRDQGLKALQRALPMLLAAFALQSSSCQMLVDTSTTQCARDEDCKALDPYSWCSSESVCTGTCKAHSDCDRFGSTVACIDRQCTELLTDECGALEPADVLQHDDAILLGFLVSDDSYGAPLAETAAFALAEIESSGGLPGDRHLGAVMCSHSTEKQALDATSHLIEKVNVPAIMGSSYSGFTAKIATLTKPKGVLIVSPSATSPALSSQGPLLRRTAPSDTLQGELLKWLVEDVRSALLTNAVIAEGDMEAPRVVMLVKQDQAGDGLYTSVTYQDANSAPAPKGSRDYIYMPDPAKSDDADWKEIVDFVLDKKPHIVLALGTGEFVTHVLPEVERRWTETSVASDYRPWYVLPEGNRVDELQEFVNEQPQYKVQERLVGTAPGARQSNRYDVFANKFQLSLSKPPGNLAEFAYDTVYWIAYGILLSGKHQPSGEQLAAGLQKVTCKDEGALESAAKPLDFPSVAALLYADPDTCFDLQGASGPLDFDEQSGDAPSDMAMWCLKWSEDDSVYSFQPLSDYYSVTSNSVQSTTTFKRDFSTTTWCNADPGLP
jgi:ABC-type branched-subunit amino acid transport system substrate-binding protein